MRHENAGWRSARKNPGRDKTSSWYCKLLMMLPFRQPTPTRTKSQGKRRGKRTQRKRQQTGWWQSGVIRPRDKVARTNTFSGSPIVTGHRKGGREEGRYQNVTQFSSSSSLLSTRPKTVGYSLRNQSVGSTTFLDIS